MDRIYIFFLRKPSRCVTVQVYIYIHFTSDTTIIKYTIVSANILKVRGLDQVLQCAYNMGSHSVYNCDVCNITTVETYICE